MCAAEDRARWVSISQPPALRHLAEGEQRRGRPGKPYWAESRAGHIPSAGAPQGSPSGASLETPGTPRLLLRVAPTDLSPSLSQGQLTTCVLSLAVNWKQETPSAPPHPQELLGTGEAQAALHPPWGNLGYSGAAFKAVNAHTGIFSPPALILLFCNLREVERGLTTFEPSPC